MSVSPKSKALALFSGGLDSILAARLIAGQGLDVICLHFVSPFFGHPGRVAHWRRAYGLDIRPIDIGDEYVRMLIGGPEHGFGSVLNPCVDCKIIMLRRAAAMMADEGACCVISGEVLGQRPMSQRRDTLNIIIRDAGLQGRLLRPLCALHLEPTEPELSGVIDRSRLLNIAGRGRKRQLELAREYGLKDIPTPGGGCRLTEKENARSYWPVLRHVSEPRAVDFHLANTGRQYWRFAEGEPPRWLVIGRNQADNDALMRLAGPRDMLFKTRDFPGPVALGRHAADCWGGEALARAASFVSSYSGKAARHSAETGSEVAVRAHPGSLDEPGTVLAVKPERGACWREYTWEETRDAVRNEAKQEHCAKNPRTAGTGDDGRPGGGV